MPFLGTCLALLNRFTPCSKQATALVTIEDLKCALCPVHLFEHLAEQVGIIAMDGSPPLQLHEAWMTTMLVQSWKSTYPTAAPHIEAAMRACEAGDVAKATADLQAARAAIEAEVKKLLPSSTTRGGGVLRDLDYGPFGTCAECKRSDVPMHPDGALYVHITPKGRDCKGAHEKGVVTKP